MKPFREWDFTLEKYGTLCKVIRSSDYSVFTVADYHVDRELFDSGNSVILRHDVDRRPENAVEMSRIEAALGIRATYYFRAKKHTFKPKIITEIADLGHEIGYHYECLSDAHGNMEEAIADFEKKLAWFRELVPVRTICMHGSPLSKWDNRDLWSEYDFGNYGIIGEPYLSIDHGDVVYLSDTGRNWDCNSHNVRDRVRSGIRVEMQSTADLLEALATKQYGKLHILCHPERWAANIPTFVAQLIKDSLTNLVKWTLR